MTDKTTKLRPRHRRIRAISMAPALVTLGNLISGFAAVHFAARPEYGINNPTLAKLMPTNLAIACYLVFLAMVCDALDGRLARFARTTSDFGGQLDSLADVVSFGLAPAFISLRLIMTVFGFGTANAGTEAFGPAAGTLFGRFCWIAAGAFLACAALRLARFNAENVPDESAHMSFKGLPAPGAAGALISFVLLNEEVFRPLGTAAGPTAHSIFLAKAMPFLTLTLGLLMVSRLPYLHLVNRFLRGKKPFWVLVVMILVILALLMWPQLVLAIGLCGYAASGPVTWLVTLRSRRAETTNGTTKHE